jgi:hypothetical protein
MKKYSTPLAFVLLIGTVLLQILILWIGQKINAGQISVLYTLKMTATQSWVSTSTFLAKNPLTSTPTPSATPIRPTSTPISCLAVVAAQTSIYPFPAQGMRSDSLVINVGDQITVIGKLRDEPWWRVYYPGTSTPGWIEDGKLDTADTCSDVAEIDLSFLIADRDAYKIIVQDTFNSFDYDWRDKDAVPNERPVMQGVAQLHLEDRSSKVDSQDVARLENLGVPTPFQFITTIHPFSFYDTSYVGFRFASASDPENSWVEFRLIRKYCTIEWQYSLGGEITSNPPFTLGESAGCGNDDISDLLTVQATYAMEADAIRFSGKYNDITLPSLTVFDREGILQLGSLQLTASKGDILFDYFLLYQPK